MTDKTFTSDAFNTLENFDEPTVGPRDSVVDWVTCHDAVRRAFPAILRVGLAQWFGPEERPSAAEPCGFALWDPDVKDCRAHYGTGARVLWRGCSTHTRDVQAIVGALMAEAQNRGRWTFKRNLTCPSGEVFILWDGRGHAAQPRSTLPEIAKRRRTRQLAETSTHGWETLEPGASRPYLDVTAPALHSSFTAWAKRRGLVGERIETRKLCEGMIEVTRRSGPA